MPVFWVLRCMLAFVSSEAFPARQRLYNIRRSHVQTWGCPWRAIVDSFWSRRLISRKIGNFITLVNGAMTHRKQQEYKMETTVSQQSAFCRYAAKVHITAFVFLPFSMCRVYIKPNPEWSVARSTHIVAVPFTHVKWGAVAPAMRYRPPVHLLDPHQWLLNAQRRRLWKL